MQVNIVKYYCIKLLSSAYAKNITLRKLGYKQNIG